MQALSAHITIIVTLMKRYVPMVKSMIQTNNAWFDYRKALSRILVSAVFITIAFFAQAQSITVNSGGVPTTICPEDRITVSFSFTDLTASTAISFDLQLGGTTIATTSVTSDGAGDGSGSFTNAQIPVGTLGGNYSLTVQGDGETGTGPAIEVIPPSLLTNGVVDEEDFYCPGDTIEIEYTARCLRTTQDFSSTGSGQLQLRISDENGDFSSGVLMTLATPPGADLDLNDADPTTSTLLGIIPDDTPSGMGYEFRVETSNGFFTSGEATDDDVVIRGLIISDPDPFPAAHETYCQGERLDFMYVSPDEGYAANNEFLVVLSNPDGTFPVAQADRNIIGRVRSTDLMGDISGIIPFDQAGGDMYFIRLESTTPSPEILGCEYGPFAIQGIRPMTGEFNDASQCAGDALNFDVDALGSTTYGTVTYEWQSICYDTIVNERSFPSSLYASVAGSADGDHIIAGSGDGIIVSNDGGATFSRITVADDYISKVFYDTLDERAYAIGASGVYVENTAGGSIGTFTQRTVFGETVNDVFAIGDDLYAVTVNGLYESDDAGVSFDFPALYGNGGRAVHVQEVGGEDYIYVATFNGVAIKRGDDPWATYSPANGLPSTDIRDIEVTPDGVIYVATSLGLAFSTDGGYTYQTIDAGLINPELIYGIDIIDGMIFLATENGVALSNVGVVEDMDSDVTFTYYNDRNGIGDNFVNGVFAAVTGTDTKRFFAATNNGLSGTTFTITTEQGPNATTGLNTTRSYENAKCRYQAIVRVERTQNGETKVCKAVTGLSGGTSIPPNIDTLSTSGPSQCGSFDGEIVVTGLLPNLPYKIEFSVADAAPFPMGLNTLQDGDTITTDEDGNFKIGLLPQGEYTITAREVNGLFKTNPASLGCPSNTIVVVLSDPDPPANPVAGTFTGDDMADPFCIGSGAFVLALDAAAPDAVTYQWSATADAMETSASKADTFQPLITPTTSGNYYVFARNDTSNCSSDTIAIPFFVQPAPTISVDKTQPTTETGNGSITITIDNAGSFPTGTSFTYTYDYTPEGGTASPQTNITTDASITFSAPQGNYTDIKVTTTDGGCESNVILACPIAYVEVPDDAVAGVVPATTTSVTGGPSGYFQSSTGGCAANLHLPQQDAIAVGRIRGPQIPPGDEEVELRGYVRFDLDAMGIPPNAVIERVEYRPVSLTESSRVVCGPEVTTNDIARGVPLRSATGDLQFDVTRVEDANYGPYLQGYNAMVFQDLFDEKYNDFTISADEEGAWTDLGTTGVLDVQRRLNELYGLDDGRAGLRSMPDGIFQVGLSLSGSDFDIPVLQFHGVAFAPANQHELRVTYHLRDYGDHAEGKYLTDLDGGVEGPSHRIDMIDVDPDPTVTDMQIPMYIGTAPDAELNGLYSDMADGDDNDGTNDEDLDQDSFTNPATDDALIAGNEITLSVPYTNNIPNADGDDTPTGTILVFIDWDDDGVFNNTNERYMENIAPGTGTAEIDIAIPATTTTGMKAVRVRITSDQVVDAYGHAINGEVEDFFTQVTAYDYADLPDDAAGTGMGNYETIYALDGARGPRHSIIDGLSIGTNLDAEADGQPQANAFGDDVNGIDDEDGVTPPDSIIRGEMAVFEVVVVNQTAGSAWLYGFADWDDDGDFEDTDISNQKATPVEIPAGASGVYEVVFDVPQEPNPLPEQVATRFRLTNIAPGGGNPVTSLGPDDENDIVGEVEDLFVNIVGYDWGDLPEPKYITDARGGQPGPSHKITADASGDPALYIGATVPDAEIQGQPDATAMGDDNNTNDDEDLTENNFVDPTDGTPTVIVAGDPIRLDVPYTNNLDRAARILAFIDWNADGDFNDDQELRMETVNALSSGTVEINYTVPDIPSADSIGVRVRITSDEATVDAYGQASDGEVEDLYVERRGAEYGDLPDLTAGTGPNDFQTLEQNDGPRHGVPVTPLVYLGSLIDSDADGQPNGDSTGDDDDTPQADDEDGIIFLTPLVPGEEARLSITAVNNDPANTANIFIWTDWENDGTLDPVTPTSGATTIAAGDALNGEVITFNVPASASFAEGNAFWRFRITTDAEITATTPGGLADDGEVEDYLVPVFKVGNLVWEDRNHNGLQDEEEIDLGIEDVRVVLRFGGVDPITGAYDGINPNTEEDPTITTASGGADLIEDFVIETVTDAEGLYLFTGMIEGNYQLISVDPSGATPTRPDWIDNVTEEDIDSDGEALRAPWEYLDTEIRQAKTQVFVMDRDSIGTDEEGILDQGNPQLQDPNALEGFPDNRVEQRIDFGYTPFDFGDLRDEDYLTVEDGVDIGINLPGLFPTATVEVGNPEEGPKHIVTPDIYLGSCSDAEVEGQPDFDAGQDYPGSEDGEGDDPMGSMWDSDYPANTCTDDDNGVQFMTPLIPGYEAIIDVDFWTTINNDGPDAFLQAFIDWNGDGDFYVNGDPAQGFDPNEQIVFTHLNAAEAPIEPNTNALELEMSQQLDHDPIRLTFDVPEDAKFFDGTVLARFRIGKEPNMAATGILPANANFPDGIVPFGEVEDYFMKLVKIGNIVWEDRDYDGMQDEDEPGIAGVEITLDYFGNNDQLDGDFYENTYVTETDENGVYYFYGLLGNVDPSGVMDPHYTLTASDPEAMTPTIDIDSIAPGEVSNCMVLNSDGNDVDIDDGITAVTFSITNPMTQCTGEMDPDGKLDMGTMLVMEMTGDDNIWPDNQMDETFDFGYVGFDYGDLPDTSIAAEFLYLTKRDWLPDAPIDFGPRHAIQPKLYLGTGVDAELDGQPDDDAGSKEGGDDEMDSAFAKGAMDDDENGIRLLSPLLPGERAFIQVTYTSRDTLVIPGEDGDYQDRDAFLNAFIDFNGDGDLDDSEDVITFTHQGADLASITALGTPTSNPTLPGGEDQVQVFAFDVPDTMTTYFNDGVAFMRYRLSWEGNLGPDNNAFHQTTPPHVDTGVEYPRGEVEDYAIPVARIGNLAWYDHNVNGHQDDPLAELYNMYRDEYGVDTLHLVLIWGGVDPTTGDFDTVGYNDETMSSLGAIEDIQYNRTITIPGGTYAPDDTIKTNGQGLYTFQGLIPGTYNLIPLKYLQADSASFVDFWPKHRVLTLTDNPDAPDDRDSDACPGIVFTIDDANDNDPEVCVDNLPEGEDGELDDVESRTPIFADNQWDQTLDFGWVDEPNIEANLDIVGVNFPTSQICGNFNVIMHLCVKNPTEVPLDSLMMMLNLEDAYGMAFYKDTKPMVSIVDSSFVTMPPDIKVKKTMKGSKEALTEFINMGYDGYMDTQLLTGGDKDTDFFLPGDSIVCVRVEFEIDPTQTDAYTANGWASQFRATARAVGFLYEDDGAGRSKRPLIDKFPKSPRFGEYIEVTDLSDEFDDPMPMAGMMYPEAGDGILFEGMVSDRGDFGEYQVFNNNLTGRDKYLDENDPTLQNDECWINTREFAGQDNITIGLDELCEAYVTPDMVIQEHISACGFDKYPEGSYYRVIIKDKKTDETLWASVDREPFHAMDYLDRELIYEARSVANHCQVVWGEITFEDKKGPMVMCPADTDTSLTTGLQLVCTDVDSILNNPRTWEDPTYAYYTGVATAVDNCGPAYLNGVQDAVEFFTDCQESADNDYAYARLTRTFTFRDQFENTDTCKQFIYFYRPKIQLPDCYVFLPNNVAGDDDVLSAEDMVGTYERPESVPYIINAAGARVYLTGSEVCGFSINYETINVFPTPDGCGRKIERRWRILDWCYSEDTDYPDYYHDDGTRGDCYAEATEEGNVFSWVQTIEVGDTSPPIVTIPDLDEDGFSGSGYKGGPAADPEVSTATYDADDEYVFSTRGQDCFADFRITQDMFEVEEQSSWCFDAVLLVHSPVLDLDERPTGEFMIEPYTGPARRGSCEDGFLFTDVEMPKDTFTQYLLELRFFDACGKDTIIYAPIQIIDDVKPTVVCNDELDITFDNQGTGRVAAIDVDEGTNDNCGFIRWLKVRRPLNECGPEFATIPDYVDANANGLVDAGDYVDENRNEQPDELEYFTLEEDDGRMVLYTPLLDEVPFFCCDRDSVKVELWAEDWSGNRNHCWTWADLTNRPPIDYTLPNNYTLPDDVVINCLEEEGKVIILAENEGQFAEGSLVYQTAISLFGGDVEYSEVNNTCPGFTQEIVVEADIDDCGFGEIEVTWLISNGDEVRNAGTRVIDVVALHDYWLRLPQDETYICNTITEDDIRGVTFSENACDLLAVSTENERFTATQDPEACYKIFRTYRIINWCEYDGEAQPTVISRDWDALNGTNPSEPDGDDEPGSSDLYVIIKRDLSDGEVDTVYYDNDSNPNVDNGTDDPATTAVETYWWRVLSGNNDPSTEDYYEGNGSVWADDGNQTDSDISGNANSDDLDARYGSFGYWQYTQHIVVYDDEPPVLTITGRDTFPALNNETCDAEVNFTIDANDECTTVADDVTIQVVVDGTDVTSQLTGGTFTGRFDEGEHTMIVIANDGCGNESVERRTFVVEDRKGPSPIVIDAVSIEMMSSDDPDDGGGMAEVWATDFLASAIYDCNGQDATDTDDNGNPRVTKFSINIVGDSVIHDQAGLTFTCADAVRTIEVEIHAWDTEGNHDFAVTNLLVQDNMGVCDDPAGEGQISGVIQTEREEAVNGVDVQLSGDESSMYVTNATGTFSFTGLRQDFDFSVIPQKDDYHGNGVSTLDLILMQRHILGRNRITSPYAQIAADVNKSGNISTLDMIQLRRLILSEGSTFENNTSWRFVDANYVFPDPSDAFADDFPEVRNINNLQGEEVADFMAIKIGDVNGSALTYLEPRSNRELTVDLSGPKVLQPERDYTLELRSAELKTISGYQFSLEWDAAKVELVDVEEGLTRDEHLAVFPKEGALTTSWNQPGDDVADSGILFRLVVRTTEPMELQDVLQLSSRLTAVEAYEADTDELMGIQLQTGDGAIQQAAMELYQNIPNPFISETRIGFWLPQASRAELMIRDVAGRVLRVIEGDYEQGYNEVRLDRQNLPAGTLYYTLTTDNDQQTKVMLLER